MQKLLFRIVLTLALCTPLATRADVSNSPDRQDQSSLLTAAVKKNDCRTIVKYLNAGGNPYTQIPLVYDETTNQPLIVQVVSNFKCLKSMLRHGVDINRKISGDSLLMYAVYAQNKESAELLLSRGADVNTLNRQNLTPLAMAISQDDGEMVNLLLRYGAKEKVEKEEAADNQDAATEESSFSEVKPSIILTPQEIDLGQVTTGNLATALITISAEDGKEVRVSEISVENPPYDKFEYTSDCNDRAITNTQTCGIEIAWSPENADSFQGKFKILWQETNTSDNSAQQAEVKISGTAAPAAPMVDYKQVKTVRLIFDLRAKPVGYIGEDEKIYDFNQNIIGKLDKNEDVRDESDKIIGRFDNVWRDLLFDESGNITGWKDDDGTVTKLNN